MFLFARSFSISGNLFPGIDNSAYSAIMDRRDTNTRQYLCGVHIQTLLYIVCAITFIVSLSAIAIGILLTVHYDWHEFLLVYKQFLAYLRRADPQEYWLWYKVVALSWTIAHFIHLATVILTLIGAQTTRPQLLVPQLIVLLLLTGVYIFAIATLLVLSLTRTYHLLMSISFIIIFSFFAAVNLAVHIVFFRFISDKADALQEILANTKTVTFKDNRDS